MCVLKIIYALVLILSINKLALCQDETAISTRYNYTANDLITELSKLANENVGRQRFPSIYDDYPSYYNDGTQNVPNPQRPYKKRKQKPYIQGPPLRPNYDQYQQAPLGRPPYDQYQQGPLGRPPYDQYQQGPPGRPYDQYQQQYPQGDAPYDPYLQQAYPQGDPLFPGSDGPLSSLSQALYSIARHDDQNCVPRLLCEVAAGGNPGGRQTSIIPSFLNMESLFTLLSAFTGNQVSPFLVFGRAAILGATSGGNPSSCRYAYPQCPRDPDRLLDYLNNHNGGFFRFFNGLQQPQSNYPYQQQDPQLYQQDPQQYQQYYQGQQQQPYPYRPNGPYRPNRYRPRSKDNSTQEVQSRILTKLTHSNSKPSSDLYISQSYFYPDVIKGDTSFKFPEESRNDIRLNVINNNNKDDYFKFPSVNNIREPKKLFFPSENKDERNQDIFYPTPLPFYDHSKAIFPDRTGTGNLKFDSNKLLQSAYNHYYDNNLVTNYDRYQPQASKPTYVYVVKDDPNRPEIVQINGRRSEMSNQDESDERKRRGIPWTFPSHLQGVIYNDRSFDVKE